MDCQNCGLEKRIEVAEQDIKDLQSRQGDQKGAIIKIETTLEYIKNTLDDVKGKVEKLAEEPSRRWNAIINALIAGVVGALAAAGMLLVLK